MVHKEHLYRQADALHTRLQASVYHVLCIYARLPYNEPRAYTDPRVVRLKRLIAKADARRQRRYREYSRWLATPPPAEHAAPDRAGPGGGKQRAPQRPTRVRRALRHGRQSWLRQYTTAGAATQ